MKVPLTPIRFLRYAQAQYPNRTAVVCGDQRFTYTQFAERVGRLAGALRSLNAQPGDRIAFLSMNCHRLLEAYYGVVETGCILLPLNIRLSPQEIAYILRDSGAKFLFVEKMFLPMVEAFRKDTTVQTFIMIDGNVSANWLLPQTHEELLAASPVYQCDLMQVDEDAVAEMFYTSGTSAEPKGVALTNRNLYLHALITQAAAPAHTQPEITVELHSIPLFHANGWGCAHYVTMGGGTHIMLHHFDPVEVLKLIARERVTTSNMVPAMATALVNVPDVAKYDLSSLVRISLGGAACSPTLVRQVEDTFKCLCYGGYGLTETAPVLSISPMKAGLNWEGEQRYNGQAKTGYAIPCTEIRVVDENMNDVPPDGKTMGEIVARGDQVMESYWNQPEATAQAFEGGWFHTGDMAVMGEHGYFLIADRKKDIIVSGGENISSLEVEKAVLAHPSVYEVAIIPVPDKEWGEVPKALVVLKPGKSATEAELIEFVRGRLAHYKCPKSVEFYEALPKTGTGKLLKRELRKKYWPGVQEAARGKAAKC